ncbi:MAG: 1-deoxy-D-xylulose-5-phosphate reductoisomerase [Alphaproteobacteria bacterium]
MSFETSTSQKKKKVTILGVTGSVGRSTVDVITSSPGLFDVETVTAHTNVDKLAKSAVRLGAKRAVIGDHSLEGKLISLLQGHSIEVRGGQDEIISAAADPADLIVAAMMGFSGLKPIIAALEAGTDVAIANKEPLVAAGEMIMSLSREHGSRVLPVDSEHNAIFQVFEDHNRNTIERLILTASGGPFLRRDAQDIYNATPEQAIAHPNWSMGAKISVDSATLMNKALEIIEAAHLFSMTPDKIDVVVHPQSIVHSIVSYKDGSMLAQMGASDMRTPIASALAWPARLERGGTILDLVSMSADLSFESPDLQRFPSLSYAYKCLELGQGACIIFNAANEVAVARFLERQIAFGDIMPCVAHSIDVLYPELVQAGLCESHSLKTVAQIEELDTIARQRTNEYINGACKTSGKVA